VAEDLLKNNGQKFLEMMERLADRRLQQDKDAVYEQEEYDDDDDEYDDDDDDDYDVLDEVSNINMYLFKLLMSYIGSIDRGSTYGRGQAYVSSICSKII
jgi:hypothetical protein